MVSNITSSTTLRRLKLRVVHYDPIARSSKPFRRTTALGFGDMAAAVWTVPTLKPRESFRVSFRLPFFRHADPKQSNFVVSVRVNGRWVDGLYKDLTYIRPPPFRP